jgi:hypothetical protein
MLDINTLNEQISSKGLLLKDFPISQSLVSMIDVLGRDYFEDWSDKVFIEFHDDDRTVQSINDNWNILNHFCDRKKLNEFISKFTPQLVYISKLESVLIDYNGDDYHRYRIYDLIDPIIEELSEEYMKCVDSTKFIPLTD